MARLPAAGTALSAVTVYAAVLCGCTTSGASECDALSPEECLGVAGCAVIDAGQLAPPGVLDTGTTCWTEVGSASVACQAAELSCPPEERYAADPSDGSCWVFAGGCTPAGWGACEEEPASICP